MRRANTAERTRHDRNVHGCTTTLPAEFSENAVALNGLNKIR